MNAEPSLPNRAVSWLDERHRAHLLAAAIFAVLLFVFFSPALIGGKVFTVTATQGNYVFPWAARPTGYPFAVQADQADLSIPALEVQQRAYEQGELPEVDLYSYGGGYPLFADYATGQGYPPRMLVAKLFDPLRAHLVFTIVHLFAAGLFTYLLVRRFGMRWLTGILAGTSWMLGSWTLAWMHLAPFLVLSALLPAGLWAVHRACRRPGLGSVTVAGVALGANVIAGQALFGIVAAGIIALYGLGLCARHVFDHRRDDRRSLLPTVAVVPAAGVLAGLLWAFVLLPLAAVKPDAARAPLTYAELTKLFLAEPRDLLNVVWPWDTPVGNAHINDLAFVGFLTGALAIIGLFTRRPGAGLGRALVLILSAAMVGGPMTWVFFHLVPTMSLFRPYTRLAFFLGFGVVLLGAAGFEWLADQAGRLLVRFGAVSWRPVAFVAVGLAVALNAGHLMQQGRRNNPAFPPDDAAAMFPDNPFTVALRDAAASNPNGWPGRAVILKPQQTPADVWSPPILWGAEAAHVGVEATGGYNATLPQRTERNLRVLSGEPVGVVVERDTLYAYMPELTWGLARYDLFRRNGYDLVVTAPSSSPNSPFGAKHVATGELTVVYEGPEGNVYRIPGATAGAHGVDKVALMADDTQALATFSEPATDPAAVLLTADEAQRLGHDAAKPLAVATISDASRSPNGYRFTATADADTLVVVPVNWSSGWSATANGQTLDVGRGNYNQVVVRVPAGSTPITLSYRAPGLRTGALITALTILFLLVAGAALAVRRRRGSRAESPGDAPDARARGVDGADGVEGAGYAGEPVPVST